MVIQIFKSAVDQVKSINRKYHTPHMALTPPVRFSLGMLRFYLLFLVGLMVYKFIITVMHR